MILKRLFIPLGSALLGIAGLLLTPTIEAQAVSRFQNPPVLWDVLTQHQDAARTGAQLHETILKPSNVAPGSFGRLYERNVEGQVITQPLYVSNQSIPGKGLHNVVYVAT